MKTWIILLFFASGVAGHAKLLPGHHKIYNDADVNKDGRISLEEWLPVVKARFEEQGKSGWEKQAPKQFKNMDKDKDGFLSLEEFWPGQIEKPQNKAGLVN